MQNLKEIFVTMHEPRNNIRLYDGEEQLDGIPRGDFSFKKIEWIKEYCSRYEKELGVKIYYLLERENFGSSKDCQKFKEPNIKYYKFFDNHILSTHFIPKNSKDDSSKNLRFFDGIATDFIEILEGHGINNFNIESFVPVLITYANFQIDFVKREGESENILGHIDVIKSPIYDFFQSELTNDEIQKKWLKWVNDAKVQDKYRKLFEEVKKRGMFIELNLSGKQKGVGVFGIDFFDLMNEVGVKICIGSDSHSVEQEYESMNNE